MDHKSFEIFVPSRYSSLIFFPFSSPFLPQFPGVLSYDYLRESRYSRFRSKREDSARKATRLERNDGSTVTASGLGLNSHYTHLGVHTARCVPRRIACVRTYRRMRERWCLAHIRRPPGQLQAPTSSCQVWIANLFQSTLLKSQQASRQLLAQHEAGGQVPTF